MPITIGAPEETRTIEATGSGTSVTASTHNALYEALCEALGAIVSAEIVLEDDALREKIVVYTDGFIEDYEVLDQTEVEGIHTTTVVAQVSITSLGAELRNWGVDTTKVDGKVLAARARIKTASQAARARLVHHALFRLNGMVHVELGGGWEMLESDANEALLSVPFHYWVDVDAYRAWHDKFIPWFERMAANPPRSMRLTWERAYLGYLAPRGYPRSIGWTNATSKTQRFAAELTTLWVHDPTGNRFGQYCFDFGSNPWWLPELHPAECEEDQLHNFGVCAREGAAGIGPYPIPGKELMGNEPLLVMSALSGDGDTILVMRGHYSGAEMERPWHLPGPGSPPRTMDRYRSTAASGGLWNSGTVVYGDHEVRTAIPTLLGSADRHIGPTPLMIPTTKDCVRGEMKRGYSVHWMIPKPGKMLAEGRFNYMQELRFSLSLEELERVTELRIELLWPEKCCANVH